ncbi:MAG: aminoacetone oxidase family FAD-binding enzyme [Firmicutes bacterium]|nr:aminoacetone oxidase family FAD-binding enzyme [Bacillota bacterium]
MKNDKIYDIAILGAGAAGLMAAIAARRTGACIAVLEKNEYAGRKLYATGNGRCNVLNRTAAAADYRSGDGDAAAFAAEVFAQCGPAQLQTIFESLGLDTVEEGEGRLYPRSLQAASVVHALERGAFGEVPDCGDPAELICGFEAKEARRDPDGSFCVTAADGRDVRARRLLLASGGKAGIQYGCDGRGLKIAESLGHRIVRPIPALTGFVCEETDLLEKLAGVRVRGTVRLYAQQEGGEPALLSEDTGEIQFNKDSVSGICVMNVSGYYRRRGEERFFLSLDVLPEWDEAALAEKLARRKASLGDCFLDALLPEKLAAAVMEPAEKKGQTPESVAHLLKKLTFTPAASKGWKDAHTTSGGIALDEIDPKTMGSKLAPGLYAAGEALDVDGPCGGYSLTWAFASGWIAGQKAVRNG